MEWVNQKGYYELSGLSPFVAYFSTKLGFPPVNYLLCLNQLHTGIVQVVPVEPETPGDALVTDRKGLFVSVKASDCGSVFLFDMNRPALGLAHAGWRGALVGVHLNTLAMMSHLYGTKPANIVVALGPMICGGCYRVGEEVARLFPGFVTRMRGAWFLDLPGYIVHTLTRAGVRPDNIIPTPACTAEDRRLWSARRDGPRGRNWAIACIERY